MNWWDRGIDIIQFLITLFDNNEAHHRATTRTTEQIQSLILNGWWWKANSAKTGCDLSRGGGTPPRQMWSWELCSDCLDHTPIYMAWDGRLAKARFRWRTITCKFSPMQETFETLELFGNYPYISPCQKTKGANYSRRHIKEKKGAYEPKKTSLKTYLLTNWRASKSSR